MSIAEPPLDLERPFDPVDPSRWSAEVTKLLGGAEPSSLDRRLSDGVTVRALYLPPVPDGVARPPVQPGAPPFVRGSQPRHRPPRLVDRIAPGTLDERAERVAVAAKNDVDAVLLDATVLAGITCRDDLARFLGDITIPVIVHADSFAGAGLDTVTASIVFDPLAWIAKGILTPSIPEAMRRLRTILARPREKADSDARPILVDGRLAHDAGAGAADELAVAIAFGVAYLRRLSAAGHPLADLPSRMEFALAVDSDQLLGMAKLRAARWLWSKVLRTAGIDGPEQGMRIHAFTSRRDLGFVDTHANLLRGTVATFAAITGGADRVTVTPFEESAHGARLARNTFHLLRAEASLDAVQDPGGGSYAIEALTEALARRAWHILQEIEHLGGAERGLVDGSLRERIEKSAAARRETFATARALRLAEDRSLEVNVPDGPSTEPSVPIANEAPRQLRETLAEDSWIDALSAHATTPMADLRAALGATAAPSIPRWPTVRDAEPFEQLHARRRSLAFDPRQVHVRFLGARAEREASVLVRSTLALAGLSSSAPSSLDAPLDDARVLVLLGDEASLISKAPALIAEKRLLIAGSPPSEALKQAGFSAFVHDGADRFALLDAVMRHLEETSA